MNYLSTEQVLYLHFRIIAESGGSQGVANLGLFQSAVARPHATFGGGDLYPDLFCKAAALFESLIGNHPFLDGNKRTGVAAGALFLLRNGRRLTLSNEELERLGLDVAGHKLSLADIADVLRRGSVPVRDATGM